MKLAIISHTEHYLADDGSIVGWGPTITEINNLLAIFEDIQHIAMLHEGKAPASALPYISDRIKFIPIPVSGGTTLMRKFDSIFKAPRVIGIVRSVLKDVDVFQMRAPTGIGVYLIPYLTLCIQTKGWYKYAGNWKQKNAPIGYAMQRWMLKKQSRKVTINGQWDDQPNHCITFENPCLDQKDIENGMKISRQKTLNGKISFCFVGRLEREKGIERIIKAFQNLENHEKTRVACVHLVGDGIEMEFFKEMAKDCDILFKFHGFLNRDDTHNIYKDCQVFLLPTTASEGFPKVIAESMNYGCIPIVSDLSSIGQYVKNEVNGLLIYPVTIENFASKIRSVFMMHTKTFLQYQLHQKEVVTKFTYDAYHDNIKTKILK